MGKEYAHKMLEDCHKATSEEAKIFGLVSEVVPHDRLLTRAQVWINDNDDDDNDDDDDDDDNDDDNDDNDDDDDAREAEPDSCVISWLTLDIWWFCQTSSEESGGWDSIE